MSFGWKTGILAGVAALTLVGAAQAADLDVAPGEDWYSQEQSSGYRRVYEAPALPRRYWQERRFYGQRDEGFYGRPVAEARPWNRPVFARPAWSHGDGCRVIIKERVGPWGDRDVRRIRICD
jgi:hypothetical protein